MCVRIYVLCVCIYIYIYLYVYTSYKHIHTGGHNSLQYFASFGGGGSSRPGCGACQRDPRRRSWHPALGPWPLRCLGGFARLEDVGRTGLLNTQETDSQMKVEAESQEIGSRRAKASPKP